MRDRQTYEKAGRYTDGSRYIERETEREREKERERGRERERERERQKGIQNNRNSGKLIDTLLKRKAEK